LFNQLFEAGIALDDLRSRLVDLLC